jgi:hypothetical protein
LDELKDAAEDESTEDTTLDETVDSEEDFTPIAVEEGESPLLAPLPPQPANSINTRKVTYPV